MPKERVVFILVLESLIRLSGRTLLFPGLFSYGMQLDAFLCLLNGHIETGGTCGADLLITYGVKVKYLQQVVFLGFFLCLISLTVGLTAVEIDVVFGYECLI